MTPKSVGATGLGFGQRQRHLRDILKDYAFLVEITCGDACILSEVLPLVQQNKQNVKSDQTVGNAYQHSKNEHLYMNICKFSPSLRGASECERRMRYDWSDERRMVREEQANACNERRTKLPSKLPTATVGAS